MKILYKDIPNIDILSNELLTSAQIRKFLNISGSTFDKMKMNLVKYDKGVGLYSKSEFLVKIENRIEIYKQCEFVPDFPGYLVNQNGEVYSIKGKVVPCKLKPKIDKNGYQIVNLTINKKKKSIGIHRIIALTYLSNVTNLPEVNHKDGNKNNNSVDNLEWCTPKYNINHSFDNELNKVGIENWRSSPIISYTNNHQIDGIFENILDCSRYYNMNENSVRMSDKNQTTYGRKGYYFRRISKKEYRELRCNDIYEKFFIKYKNTNRCSKINQFTK